MNQGGISRVLVTAAGESVGSDALGVMLPHEHLFSVNPELQTVWPGFNGWHREPAIQEAVVALDELHALGVGSMLDCTVAGLGRDLAAVAEVARRSPVKIFACTGYYVKSQFPNALANRPPEMVAELLRDRFISDITQGMENTEVRAAAIKCVVDRDGFTPAVKAVLQAVVEAHAATDAPIVCHTDAASRHALAVAEYFAANGVRMSAVCFSHSNQTADFAYLQRLYDSGGYLGFDRMGLPSEHTTAESELEMLARFVASEEMRSKILVSHDNIVFADARPMEDMRRRTGDYKQFRYVLERVVPFMQERGFDPMFRRQVMQVNPRTWLTGA